jgi:hypothetical protein
MVFKLKWVMLFVTMAVLTGCFGGMGRRQLSAEELATQQQIMQRIMGQKLKQPSELHQTNISQPSTISESELLQKINAFPAVSKRITFSKQQNGLEVNGKKLIDPEGVIKFYGFDYQTGDVTYLISTGNNSYIYKYIRVSTGLEPVKIGDAVFNNGDWKITTVTGKSFSGNKLIPLGKGFIISREDGSGFAWSPEKALQNFSAPEGFQIADFQNGDIGGTRYILCERIIEEESGSKGSFGKLFNSVKAVGSALGVSDKEDYLLLNIDTGSSVPINISYDMKNVAVHSNCKSSGKIINKCNNVQFYDSLYDKYGFPNGGHYYWAINWYNTSSGPLLLFKDNNSRDLYAQNLNNNQKEVILSRMLGINWFTSSQKSDGKVSVTAKMGFSNESVDDVESALSSKSAEKVSQVK